MRLLIAIESCQAHSSRHDDIRETWLSGYDSESLDYRFFVGRGGGLATSKLDEIWLDVDDSYEGLPLKTVAICKWAVEHRYTNLFKCDTDTYVHVPRLLTSGSDQYDYTGFYRDPFDSHLGNSHGNYASGGPGYWLSCRAMNIIANSTFTMDYVHEEEWRGHWNGEDKQVGRRLNEFGIVCHWDHRYRMDHEYPTKHNDHITAHPVVTRLVASKMYHADYIVKESFR